MAIVETVADHGVEVGTGVDVLVVGGKVVCA